MEQAVFVWALWISSGGRVNSGYLLQPAVAAYFATEAECARVQALVREQTRWSMCIQANYVLPRK